VRSDLLHLLHLHRGYVDGSIELIRPWECEIQRFTAILSKSQLKYELLLILTNVLSQIQLSFL
jgi:hypothetical protein